MPRVTPLLNASGCAELETQGRYIPRSVVLRNKGNVISYSKKAERLDLVIRREVALLQNTNWMRCWCLSARPEDGLSWSAQGIQNTLADLFPGFTHIGIPKGTSVDGLPPIAHIVGIRRFLRLASRRNLTTPFLSLRSWLTAAILAASFGLALLVKVLDALWKVKSPATAQQVGPALVDTTFWLVAALSAAAGLVTQWTGVLFSSRTKTKSVENYLSNIGDKKRSREFEDFIEDLAGELAGLSFPRTVVIDHFDQLESMTQKVIDRYFTRYSQRAIGSELWVIFESADLQTFDSYAALQPNAHGYLHARFGKQAPLTRTEKQTLGDLLGLDAQALEFESVKRICENRAGAGEALAARFKDFRSHHPADPARYGPLELTYLLALTSRPASVSVSDRFLRNNLSNKEGVPAQLLRQLLRGTTLRRDEISTALVEVREHFGSLLGSTEDDGEPQIRIAPEAADVLENVADELGLPPPGLGHLFWGTFWHAVLRRHPPEAPWMQKLARHLLEADVSRAAPELSQLALDDTIESILLAIRGCLDTCLFESIGPLLERGVLLLPSGSPSGSAQRQTMLRESCGDALVLLGQNEVVRVLAELRASSPHLVKPSRGVLDLLGLETATLRDSDDGWAGEFSQRHLQHFRLKGAWLALSLRSLLPESVRSLLAQAVSESYTELREVRESARRQAADASSSAPSAADALSFSLALWCDALAAGAIFDAAPPVALEWLSDLVGFAAGVVSLACADRQAGPHSDLLRRALSRELAATAAASIVTACHLWRERQTGAASPAPTIPDEMFGQISACLRRAAEALEDELPPLDDAAALDSPDLVAAIDNWMHLASMVWHAFRLEHLRSLAVIRRTQFNALCGHGPKEKRDHLLLQSEGAVIERQDYAGLLANCVAAGCLKHAGELSVHYIRRAGAIVQGWEGVRTWKREFSHLVIAQAHMFHTDLKSFLEDVLEEDPGGGNGLESYLEQVQPGELAGVANRYLNAANYGHAQTLAEAVNSSIRSFLNKHPDDPDALNTEALLDLDRLARQFRSKKPVSIDREMAAWTPRRESWLYGQFLRTIYDHDVANDQVRLEILRVLSEDQPWDNSNCRLLLAFSIIQRSANNHSVECAAAVRFVRARMSVWQHALSAERNVSVYTSLCWLDPEHKSEYLIPLAEWQLIRLHREHLQDFPQLVSQGQYFLLFLNYFDAMQVWGLHADVERSELARRRELSGDRRKEALERWKARSGRAVAFKGAGKSVNAEFLTIGTYIFDPELPDQNEYAEDRAAFNHAAEQALPALLQLIVALPALSKPIKELLRSHSDRLYSFSLPADLPAPVAKGATGS